MAGTILPSSNAELLAWATNYKTKIPEYVVTLNMTPEQAAEEISWCNDFITSIFEVNAQKSTYKSVLSKRNNTIKQVKKKFQKRIAQHKTSAGYTKAIGQAMGIVVSKKAFDAATYKTSLNVRMEGNKIAIRFRKLGVQGINIYYRKNSSDVMRLLSRATRSPFEFTSTVENPRQPELWEFMAFGVINDKEIGLASDIIDLMIGSKIG